MAADDYSQIRDELMGAGDEVILLRYLKPMIDDGASWPEHFQEDADVFSKNPSTEFEPEYTNFVIVNPRTEACGKTDGCDYGSWRIMARDKPIKNEQTGKLLGFKRILKFGLCIFANRTEACGYTDGCDSGCWRIMEGDEPIRSIKAIVDDTFGFRRVFEFCEDDKYRYFYTDDNGEVVLLTWIM